MRHADRLRESIAGAWADVDVTANDGSTALMLAASSGDSEIVRDLLSKGADISAKFTQTGITLLFRKHKGCLSDILQLLEGSRS